MPFVFRARPVDIDTGGDARVVLLRGHDAEKYGINPGDRLQLKVGKKTINVVADITHHSIEHSEIGLFREIWASLRIRSKAPVVVNVLSRPTSIAAISKKLQGKTISQIEMKSIIEDIVSHRLTSVETTYFVASGYVRPYSEQELIWMVKAMAETGHLFRWRPRIVVDKHSIGGLAGNRTTLIAIPIIAASGLTIPKTSSRAITSPAGTADTMEVLAPVVHSPDNVRRIVAKTGGCLIWGGGLSIAPADDIIIRVSRPLSLEPYDKMIVSIMAKKVAMGINHLVIDMPFGYGTKVPNLRVAKMLAERFARVGRAFRMKTFVQFDGARQPIGNGVGPALEARDVLKVLQQTSDRPHDLEKKAIDLAAEVLVFSGRFSSAQARQRVTDLLSSGIAWKKMKAIISAQGGNPAVTPEMVLRGSVHETFFARSAGTVRTINNRGLDDIARSLGAPDHKLAGVYLHRKIGQSFSAGDELYTLYAPSRTRLELTKAALTKTQIIHASG